MKNKHIILTSIAISALSLVVIPSLLQVPEMGSMWRKDEKFIPMLEEISRSIPENETIVSYSFDPAVFYFTGHQIEVPSNATSYDLFIDFMQKGKYLYLLTVERHYGIATLDDNFKKDRLDKLAKDFREIATYNTNFTRLHLYKRI